MPNQRDSISVKELAEAAANLKIKAQELARALECIENLFTRYLDLPELIRLKRDPEGNIPTPCFGVCKTEEMSE